MAMTTGTTMSTHECEVICPPVAQRTHGPHATCQEVSRHSLLRVWGGASAAPCRAVPRPKQAPDFVEHRSCDLRRSTSRFTEKPAQDRRLYDGDREVGGYLRFRAGEKGACTGRTEPDDALTKGSHRSPRIAAYRRAELAGNENDERTAASFFHEFEHGEDEALATRPCIAAVRRCVSADSVDHTLAELVQRRLEDVVLGSKVLEEHRLRRANAF